MRYPLSRRPTQAFPQVRIVLQALQGMRNFFRLILSNHQAARLLAICQYVGKPLCIGGNDGKTAGIASSGATGMPSMRDVVT